MTNTKRVVIIGGGISGLSLARHLLDYQSQSSIKTKITVLESGSNFGGVIQSREEHGLYMESGPDAFISERPAALELCKRIGLSEEMINTQSQFRRSFIYRDKKLCLVPEGFYLISPSRLKPFIFSDVISFKGKLRMLGELFVPASKEQGDESVGSFVSRRFGQEALDQIGQPMIGGIYMADPSQLSLLATFPQFIKLEKEHGSVIRGMLKKTSVASSKKASGPRYSLFVSLRQGMHHLIKELIASMPEVQFRTGVPVSEIQKNHGSWTITAQSGEKFEADIVCLAMPAVKASEIVRKLDFGLSQMLEQIKYESVTTANFVYDKKQIKNPINGFGFVVPEKQKKNLMACSFSSVKFPARAPEGKVILRAFTGGVFRPQIAQLSDKEVEEILIRELAEILKIEGSPEKVWISRHENAMPQYQVGHLDLVATIESKVSQLPGLYLAGNGYRGMGMPDCIQYAKRVAQQISSALGFEIPKESFSLI